MVVGSGWSAEHVARRTCRDTCSCSVSERTTLKCALPCTLLAAPSSGYVRKPVQHRREQRLR